MQQPQRFIAVVQGKRHRPDGGVQPLLGREDLSCAAARSSRSLGSCAWASARRTRASFNAAAACSAACRSAIRASAARSSAAAPAAPASFGPDAALGVGDAGRRRAASGPSPGRSRRTNATFERRQADSRILGVGGGAAHRRPCRGKGRVAVGHLLAELGDNAFLLVNGHRDFTFMVAGGVQGLLGQELLVLGPAQRQSAS